MSPMEQWRAMKPTQRAAIEGVVLAAIGAAVIGWFILPGAVWWVHLVIWTALCAGYYQSRVKMIAAENLANETRPR